MDSNEGEPVNEDAATVLDSARGTGSDEGAPGEDSVGPPLDDGEKELLNRLMSPDFGQDVAGPDAPATPA